jgi:ubiquinone biosynthesis protein COQ4
MDTMSSADFLPSPGRDTRSEEARPEPDDSERWRELALETFIGSVKARVGDFSVLQRMTDVLHAGGGDADRLLWLLSEHEACASIIAERRPLRGLDLQSLVRLPEESLGRQYAEHMYRNGLRPPPMPTHYYDQHPRNFVQRRLLELHDVWHVATGFDTDDIGEIGIGAFNVGQLPTRFFAAMLAKNLAKVALENVEICVPALQAVGRGLRLAEQAIPLFGYAWDDNWEAPLERVRAELGLSTRADRVETSA